MSVRTWEDGKEKAIAGSISIDVSAIKQEIYDGIYPVNSTLFGFAAPGIPKGVTATWTDISASYEGRYFKVSSTDAVGTSQAEQLPNITGMIGFYFGTEEQCTGVFDGSYHGMDWLKPQLSGYGPNNRIDFGANKGQVDTSYSTGYRPQAESVYKDNGVVRPLTTTIKVWKRIA